MVAKGEFGRVAGRRRGGATGAATARTSENAGGNGSFTWFLVKLLVFVLVLRSFVFSPFTIPSESMMPALLKGDYLIASKWPYGFSRYSFPFELPLIPDRIFAGLPERGDVVIFKHPVDGSDYIKRVIGLPGDTIALNDGRLELNGQDVPRERMPDIAIARDPNTSCIGAERREPSGEDIECVYLRYRETLPNGRQYNVFDFGLSPKDTFGPVTLGEGQLFVLGDNRDNSQDSRFTATGGGGVGIVDADLLVARAEFVAFSAKGTADWLKPWTWFSAARWNRIGDRL